jgi:O-antigen/teichoic acid export membrane protein
LTAPVESSSVFGTGALRQALHTIGVRSLTLVSRLTLVVLMTKTLSTSDFGAYSIISTIGAFGVFLCGLNLSAFVFRSVPGLDEDAQRGILKTTLLFEVGLTVAILLGVVASGRLDWIAGYLNVSGYRWALLLGFAVLVSLVATAELTTYFQAQTRIERANWVDFLGQAAWVAPLVALWAIGAQVTLTKLLVAQLLGGAAVLVFAFTRLGARQWWHKSFNTATLRAALVFSVPLIVPTLGVTSVRMADRFFLSHYRSVAEVGVYAFGATFINTAYSFTAGVIFSTFGPRIFAAHNRGNLERRDLLQTYMLKAALVGFGVPLIAICFLARPLIGFVAKPEYLAAVGVLPILGLSSVALIIGYPANYILMLQHRVKLLAAIDVVGMAAGIAANVVLIPKYSYYGAAAAGCFGLTVTAVLQYAFSGAWRHFKTSAMFSLSEEMDLARRFLQRLRRVRKPA